MLGAASPALAAAPGHGPLVVAPLALLGIGSFLGHLAGSVIGGVSWTVNLAGSFILNLIGGLVKLLIPRSWINQGLQILQWVVAVPDYTGKIAGPGGTHVYGFPGVNAMRGLYTWLGIAILPLTALYATSRAWSGQGDHVAMPLVRVVTVSIGVLSYTWLWGQAVALTNQITTAILGVSAVTAGIYKMFTLLVSGTVLIGLPLIGEFLLAAAAAGLLAMIFLKVVLILVGALVYAIGPLMIGLAPTERGHAIARAWASLAIALFAIGILWASVFALAAVLLNDASSGALLLGGSSSAGHLLSGVVIAMAAIAGFYANIKLTKAIVGIVAGQLSGVLAQVGGRGMHGLGRAGAAPGATPSPAGGGAPSLRGFAAKLGGGLAGAAGAVVPGGRAGAILTAGAGAGGALARGGLIGAGGALAGRGLAGAARSNLGRAAGATRAGSVATRLARGGQRGWNAAAPAPPQAAPSASSAAPLPPTKRDAPRAPRRPRHRRRSRRTVARLPRQERARRRPTPGGGPPPTSGGGQRPPVPAVIPPAPPARPTRQGARPAAQHHPDTSRYPRQVRRRSAPPRRRGPRRHRRRRRRRRPARSRSALQPSPPARCRASGKDASHDNPPPAQLPARARCLTTAWNLTRVDATATQAALTEHARVTGATCRVLVVDQRCR